MILLINNRKRIYFIFIICIGLSAIFASLLLLKDNGARKFNKITVIMRFDDYTFYDNFENYNLYDNEIFEFFDFIIKNNIFISIGVIPYADIQHAGVNKNEKNDKISNRKVEILKNGIKNGIFDICLHGLTHKNYSQAFAPSEFEGKSLAQQQDWIFIGNNKLEEILNVKPKVFIPPFNAWDLNTVIALKNNGISVLSAEIKSFQDEIAIAYFPYTATPTGLYYLMKTLSFDKSGVVILVIHPHDLKENSKYLGIKKLKEMINIINKSTDIYESITLSEAANRNLGFNGKENNYYWNLFYWIQFWKELPFASKYIHTNSLSANRPYYDHKYLEILRLIYGISLGFLGIILSYSFCEKYMRSKSRIKISILACAIVGIIFSIRTLEYIYYNQIIVFKRLSISILIVSFMVGAILFIPDMKPRTVSEDDNIDSKLDS